MVEERKAWSDVQLYEGNSSISDLPAGSDYFEDHANVIVGETPDHYVYLTTSMFHMGGGEKGKWRVDEAMIIQTTFAALPKDYEGGMHNNEFIGNRMDPIEWTAGPYKIEQQGDKVIWERDDRLRYVFRPPYWELKGDHMGVAYDLVLGGMGSAKRTFGPWEDLVSNGRAGYDQFGWVEGSITFGGRTHTLENGYGIHERLTMGGAYDPVKGMRQPYYWFMVMNDSMLVHFFAMPGEGLGLGHVSVDGKEIDFAPGDITVEDLEFWVDPTTGIQPPVGWHVSMNSGDAVVALDMHAQARGIYVTAMNSGYSHRYQFLGTVEGQISFPDGRQVPIENVIPFMEWGRVSMPLPSGNP